MTVDLKALNMLQFARIRNFSSCTVFFTYMKKYYLFPKFWSNGVWCYAFSQTIIQWKKKQILLIPRIKILSIEKWISQFSSIQSLSRVRLFATPWIAARQASLSITNPWSSLRLTSIESVMPSSHLILCRPLLLLPPIPPKIKVFSNESTLRMRWPKYWSFSFSIIPSNDFGAPENKVWHCFHCFPIYFPWSDGTRYHDLHFLNVEL